MYAVADVEILVPHHEVGHGDGEVIHDDVPAEVVLSIVGQLAEFFPVLCFASQGTQGQSLIENLFGLGIVVIECIGGFEVALRGGLPLAACLVGVALEGVGLAEEVMDVLFLGTDETSFAEMIRS